jgi:predicted dinucleotide-binding enzyme
MKIGIIGSGNIGGTLARLWARAGHEVMVSNSRGPESLRDFVAEIGARAGTVDQAARFGDVVLLATPWRSPEALPSPDAVAGKVVIDAMNPYTAEGGIHDLGDSSSSEETARRLPGTKIVKAFNTIWVRHLEANGRPDAPVDERHAVFVAGDDAGAKATVFRLIEEIGFGPVDTGSLRDGKRQEPNTNLYNQVITAGEGKKRVAG